MNADGSSREAYIPPAASNRPSPVSTEDAVNGKCFHHWLPSFDTQKSGMNVAPVGPRNPSPSGAVPLGRYLNVFGINSQTSADALFAYRNENAVGMPTLQMSQIMYMRAVIRARYRPPRQAMYMFGHHRLDDLDLNVHITRPYFLHFYSSVYKALRAPPVFPKDAYFPLLSTVSVRQAESYLGCAASAETVVLPQALGHDIAFETIYRVVFGLWYTQVSLAGLRSDGDPIDTTFPSYDRMSHVGVEACFVNNDTDLDELILEFAHECHTVIPTPMLRRQDRDNGATVLNGFDRAGNVQCPMEDPALASSMRWGTRDGVDLDFDGQYGLFYEYRTFSVVEMTQGDAVESDILNNPPEAENPRLGASFCTTTEGPPGDSLLNVNFLHKKFREMDAESSPFPISPPPAVVRIRSLKRRTDCILGMKVPLSTPRAETEKQSIGPIMSTQSPAPSSREDRRAGDEIASIAHTGTEPLEQASVEDSLYTRTGRDPHSSRKRSLPPPSAPPRPPALRGTRLSGSVGMSDAASLELKQHHISYAWKVTHPSSVPATISDVIASSMHEIKRLGTSVNSSRIKIQEELGVFALLFKEEHEKHLQTCPSQAFEFYKRCNSFLFEALLRKHKYDDPEAALIMRFGAQVEGILGGRECWRTDSAPPSFVSRNTLLDSASLNREEFLKTVRPSPCDPDLLAASEKDVKQGRMMGPYFSLDQVETALNSAKFVVSRRFGVVQPGKVRACDDARRSGVNSTSFQSKRVVLSTLDSVSAEVRYANTVFGRDQLLLWKRDHASAFRQVPLHKDEIPLSVIVFHHPEREELVFYVHLALPFGFTASVIGYNRISQAIAFLANKIFAIPVDSYFDDYWAVEPEYSSKSGFDAFGFLNELLGFDIKLEKDIHPSPEGEVLGHEIVLGSPPFCLRITLSRKTKLISLIETSLVENKLSATSASSLAGKVGFACEAMYGKVGRAPLQPVYARAHSSVHRSAGISPELRLALKWIIGLLKCAPDRPILLAGDVRSPTRAWIDAEGSGQLGVVLQSGGPEGPMFYTSGKVPEHISALIPDSGNLIQFYEMIAALLLVHTFENALTDSDLVLFCDNTAQEGALRKGRSKRWTYSFVSGLFWHRIAKYGTSVWLERVSSEENIADCPSRLKISDVAMLREVGATYVPPGNIDEIFEQLFSLLTLTSIEDVTF